MQRRFQKIVEEGPPIAVAPETLRQMELAAARLARMVDYTHAGTVEYLFIEKTQEFYFLELNPRLQVRLRLILRLRLRYFLELNPRLQGRVPLIALDGQSIPAV